MKKIMTAALFATTLPFAMNSFAADYTIDTKGAHAAINFSVSHLGFGWVIGRFNEFEGTFSYDADKPEASSVEVTIDTKSVDSNHAERDKHLRGSDFLDVEKYEEASFKSTSFKMGDDKKGSLVGDFTFHGVTKPVTIDVTMNGAGKDPWGGERAGFSGTTSINLTDYGIENKLGPASETVDLNLFIEGVKKK